MYSTVSISNTVVPTDCDPISYIGDPAVPQMEWGGGGTGTLQRT